MEIILAIIASIIVGYLTLYIFWLLPNQVFSETNTPYHAQFFGVVMLAIAIMGAVEIYGGIKYARPAYIIGGLAELLMGGSYLLAAWGKIKSKKILLALRFTFAVSAGYLIAVMVLPLSVTLAAISGVATATLCMLPIPEFIKQILTPPRPEQTAWYHVLHKFPHLRNSTSTPNEERKSEPSTSSNNSAETLNKTR